MKSIRINKIITIFVNMGRNFSKYRNLKNYEKSQNPENKFENQ